MRRVQRRKPIAEINVVPYIDVMLVLLVIFMVTTPLLSQGVKVNLPQAHAKAISKTAELPLVVSIDSHGLYYLNVAPNSARPLDANQLFVQVAAHLQVAKRQHQSQTVYVKADKSVDYGKVMTVMALLQRAGSQSIGLLAKPHG